MMEVLRVILASVFSAAALFQIGNDTIYVLCANGKTNRIWLDTLVKQLIRRKLGMCGGSRRNIRQEKYWSSINNSGICFFADCFL